MHYTLEEDVACDSGHICARINEAEERDQITDVVAYSMLLSK